MKRGAGSSSVIAAVGADRRFLRTQSALYAGSLSALGIGLGILGTGMLFPLLATVIKVPFVLRPWLILIGASAATCYRPRPSGT